MANVNISVKMDNLAQSGDESLAQLQQLVAAEFGLTTAVVDIRRNTDGKVDSVLIRLPDSISTEALAKIAESSVVATTEIVVCPDQRYTNALNDDTPDGIVTSKSFPDIGQASIVVVAGNSNNLGTYNRDGLNLYVDGIDLINPAVLHINFITTMDSIFEQFETLTLNFTASDSLALVRNSDIVIPQVSAGIAFNQRQYWIDVDGKLYPKLYEIQGAVLGFTFEEACRVGPI